MPPRGRRASHGQTCISCNATIEGITFEFIVPDAKSNWLDQSDSDFDQLVPVADRQTKLAKSTAERAGCFRLVFGRYQYRTRDEWAYDFDDSDLSNKMLFFCRHVPKRASAFYN